MRASSKGLHTPPAGDDERPSLRLQQDGDTGNGTQDGTWWPETRDESMELADLAEDFPDDHGVVEGVVFARADGDTAPRRVLVQRGCLEIGSHSQDTARQVLLRMSTGREITLVMTALTRTPSADGTAHPVLAEPAPSVENSDRDVVSPWTDAGDTWWDPEAGVPSERR
jgi:hypothetical protein